MTAINAVVVILAVTLASPGVLAQEDLLDLTRAVVIAPSPPSEAEKSALAMFLDEVDKRTQIRLSTSDRWPEDSTPVIALGTAARPRQIAGPYAAELVR